MIDFERGIEEALTGTPVTLERFREVVLRLLDMSVIVRADSQTEEKLYDDAVGILDLLRSYFAVMGCRLVHEAQFRYLQLYAPGVSIPGITTETQDASSLRMRLGQHDVAVLLILRFLYDRAIQTGMLDDDGRASVSLEELHTAMKSVLDRSLPDAATERRGIFRRLKQLKVVDYRPDADLENADNIIVIRPIITGMVHADYIQAAGEDLAPSEAADGFAAEQGDESADI